MDGFATEQWAKLTNPERIEHCRMAAREADQFAQQATSSGLKSAYTALAAQWHMLATEIERSGYPGRFERF